jgi:hypothetical protein
MSSYPWSILGLEAPASEREIRSAYARRLKVVRPDTDPAGFQQLVEARSFAFDLARSRAADALEEDDDAEDSLPEAAAIDPMSEESRLPSVAPTTLPVVVAELVQVDLAPSIAPPVSIELHDPVLEPTVAPATGELDPIFAASAGVASDAAPTETILLEPDEVLGRLRNLFRTMGPPPAPDEATRVLADLERLPRSIRQMMEPDILQAMARSLPAPVKDKFPRLSALLRWMDLIADPVAEQRAMSQMRRTLFVALDENFGWTTSDRRVHQTLKPAQAVQLMALLHASHKEQRITREGVPPRWDGDGLPILEPADLQAFFGTELPHFGVAYQEAKRKRAWAPNWRPWLLLFAPVWMLPLRQYRLLGIWLITMMFSGFLLNFVERSVAPMLKVRVAAAYEPLTLLAHFLAWTPVLAVQIHVARNSGRLEVERLARLATKADRKGLFDPQLRAAFFRQRAPRFRFEDGKKKSSGFWDNWWWIFVGIAVIRLLGMLLK